MDHRRVIRVNLLLLALLLGVSIAVWPTLPERIPMHFDLWGNPDRYVRRSWLSWLGMPLVAAFLFVFIHGLGRLTTRRPELWNVPEKDRFLRLTPEARAPIVETMRRYLAWLTLVLTAFMGLVQGCIYLVAIGWSKRLPGIFIIAVLLTVGGVLVTAFKLQSRIRNQILAADDRTAGVAR